jgi:hypothetical protein
VVEGYRVFEVRVQVFRVFNENGFRPLRFWGLGFSRYKIFTGFLGFRVLSLGFSRDAPPPAISVVLTGALGFRV